MRIYPIKQNNIFSSSQVKDNKKQQNIKQNVYNNVYTTNSLNFQNFSVSNISFQGPVKKLSKLETILGKQNLETVRNSLRKCVYGHNFLINDDVKFRAVYNKKDKSYTVSDIEFGEKTKETIIHGLKTKALKKGIPFKRPDELYIGTCLQLSNRVAEELQQKLDPDNFLTLHLVGNYKVSNKSKNVLKHHMLAVIPKTKENEELMNLFNEAHNMFLASSDPQIHQAKVAFALNLLDTTESVIIDPSFRLIYTTEHKNFKDNYQITNITNIFGDREYQNLHIQNSEIFYINYVDNLSEELQELSKFVRTNDNEGKKVMVVYNNNGYLHTGILVETEKRPELQQNPALPQIGTKIMQKAGTLRNG